MRIPTEMEQRCSTSSGAAARRFVRGGHVGMARVNVPVPVPMAFHSFVGGRIRCR